MRYLRSKRAPFAVPAVVVLAIAAGSVAPTVTGASSPPNLPSRTPQQLVADVLSAKVPELSGTVDWTANLGLSDLGTIQSDLSGGSAGSGPSAGLNPLVLLNGTYQIDEWLGGSQAEHIALSPAAGQEVDLVRSGSQAWFWDSSTMKVTHFVGTGAVGATSPTSSITATLTPQQMATRILGHLGPTTSVVAPATVYVGGQAAYELLVSPKSASGTTIDHIEVDIGAQSPLQGVPLQVAVYARGQAAPALELGFTGQIQPGPPPASELTFTPPAGATVVTRDVGGAAKAPSAQSTASSGTQSLPLTRLGSGWTGVETGTTGALGNPGYQTELDAVTTVVSVGSQQGRLFTSELLNVLIMPGGRFYAGFVTPAVLEADAAASA